MSNFREKSKFSRPASTQTTRTGEKINTHRVGFCVSTTFATGFSETVLHSTFTEGRGHSQRLSAG